MAFPDDPLGTKVELMLGGAWTDITPYARLADPITITRGRADEASAVDPGTCTVTLGNQDGRFSPRNPTGPYYGQIGRNTPLRVSVMAGPSYLSLPGLAHDDASTTPLAITGDIDIRIDATLGNWVTSGTASSTQLIGQYEYSTSAGTNSWVLMMRNGVPHFEWSPDGSTNTVQVDATAAPTIPFQGRTALRVTLDVNNGAGGWTVTFYTAPTMVGPWVQLGAPVTGSGVTSIYASTARLRIGQASYNLTYPPASGAVWAAQVLNGINGSPRINVDFTGLAPGTASWSDAAGAPWLLGGTASVTNQRLRFCGEVPSWPPSWGPGGQDVTVAVEASGILRRLGQGAKSLASTLARRVPSGSPVAYWPMEDAAGATQAYSPIPGVRPLNTVAFDFAAQDGPPGSDELPTIGTGASMTGAVPAAAPGAWHVEMCYLIEQAPALDANCQMLTVPTTVGYQWRVGVGASLIHLDVTDNTGASVFTTTVLPTNFFGSWSRLQLEASQSGSSVNYLLRWIAIGGVTWQISGTFTGQCGAVSRVSTTFDSNLQGMSLGHLGVFASTGVTIYNSADIGFAAESTHDRMYRLATEESTPLILPAMLDAHPMGPQTPDTLLDLLQQAADVDQGILYEQRGAVALAYRPRETLYNQPPTLALTYGQRHEVMPPLAPVDDDQLIRNDVTVTRTGGSSARVVQTDGPLSTAPRRPASACTLRRDVQSRQRRPARRHGGLAGARWNVG